MPEPQEITQLLVSARQGNREAFDEVFSRVYQELRRLAEAQIRRVGVEHTLGTTAIVNEAYMKLLKSPNLSWEDRGHFYAVAATAMRHILLNHARHHVAKKRGGGRPAELGDHESPVEATAVELVEIDQALTRLAALDERLARVVELRFYAGLSVVETAEVLGVTDRTIKRDWQAARAFLYRELHPDPPAGES
jgi:RNA polymerase sigma factor (TIGR02999 family)